MNGGGVSLLLTSSSSTRTYGTTIHMYVQFACLIVALEAVVLCGWVFDGQIWPRLFFCELFAKLCFLRKVLIFRGQLNFLMKKFLGACAYSMPTLFQNSK